MADISLASIHGPKPLVLDLEKAVEILKEEGCKEIYVFGSLATGRATEESDIDIGIKDYPKERFFRIYGRLMMGIDHHFDLVDFELNAQMFAILSEIREVQRIA